MTASLKSLQGNRRDRLGSFISKLPRSVPATKTSVSRNSDNTGRRIHLLHLSVGLHLDKQFSLSFTYAQVLFQSV